jgi:hypothetical protein
VKPEKSIIDEWIERVKTWMEEPGASPSLIESCKERIQTLEQQRSSRHYAGGTAGTFSRKPKINPRPDIP